MCLTKKLFRHITCKTVSYQYFKMEMQRPWKKNLYENQGYPDNYTDATFLRELRKNIHFEPVSFTDAAVGATLIVQELCTVVAFVLIYVYLYNEWTNPSTVFYYTSTATMCGFILYRVYFSQGLTRQMLGHDLRTVLIFLVFGQLFSPVLHTLTDTVSTDTIYTMTVFMMLIHLVFFDYGVSAAIVSNSLSLSAAVFASICLSSRLASAYQAFVLMTVSIKCFVLFPLLRIKVGFSLCITLILVISVVIVLTNVSIEMTVLFIISVIFLNLICPLLFTRYQTFKDNIYGPWDEAVVHDLYDICD